MKRRKHTSATNVNPPGTTLDGNIRRMENLSPTKADAIVGVIRAIMNEEMHREGPYIGMNIYQDERFPTRLNYGRSYGELYDEFGHIPTTHFIEFEDAETAAAYVNVLTGLLTLSLTPFKISSEKFAHHGGYNQDLEDTLPQTLISNAYKAFENRR